MDWMDEYDPDWAGDPKISTLKKMAFQAQKDISQVKTDQAKEVGTRTHENSITLQELVMIRSHIAQIRKENDISNLYFKGKITKEQAHRLWELYASPDEENHRIADATIDSLKFK